MKKLVLLALLAACTKVDSDNILTSGIYADLGARANGDGRTSVYATLFLENPINLNFIELQGDDELIASNGPDDKVMAETELLNIVSYQATFQTEEGGDEFVIDFVRTVDDGAPSSIVTLPEKFTVDPPASSSARVAAMTVTWAPAGSGDLMSWRASGECIDPASDSISGDSGTLAIAPNTFRKKQGMQVADTCDVFLTLTRTRLGVLDRNYGEGGKVVGDQNRTVVFSSTP